MSPRSPQRPARPFRARRRALTLTELLVAMAITLVFTGSVVTAFIQISRAADETEAQIQAHTRARAALDSLARDVQRLDIPPPDGSVQTFRITSSPFFRGNRIDDDGDGRIDEETVNGLDEDGDWADNHAVIGFKYQEREAFLGVPDLGDLRVDEDSVFHRDRLEFLVPGNGTTADQLITYRIGTFEGSDFVLMRDVVNDPGGLAETTTSEPIIFDIVSMDILAWNANNDATSPAPTTQAYWQPEFDADDYAWPANFPICISCVPGTNCQGNVPFEYPAAVYLQITVNAERLPLAELPDWPAANRPLRTLSLSTVVTIPAVTRDPAYILCVRPDPKTT